jgi:hypothetical protein
VAAIYPLEFTYHHPQKGVLGMLDSQQLAHLIGAVWARCFVGIKPSAHHEDVKKWIPICNPTIADGPCL